MDKLRKALRVIASECEYDGAVSNGAYIKEADQRLGRYENLLRELLEAAKIPYGSDVTRRIRTIELKILQATEGRVGEEKPWRKVLSRKLPSR